MRSAIGLLGLAAAVYPDRMIAIFEAAAIENPDAGTRRPWIGSAIRAEGAIVTITALHGGRAFAWLMNLTGASGVLVLLFPDLYRTFATTVLYEQLDAVTWNDRSTQLIRIIGAGYVLLAIRAFTTRHAAD